jgi:deazaflavin-dependent oxidoreductase (nitroreductase family)
MARRYSEVRGRKLTVFEAGGEAIVSSKPGAWFFVNVASRVDKRLLARSKGRWSFSGPTQNIGLLTTTGAKSGQSRATPLQFVADGERVLLVASAGGAPSDPSWAFNLRQHSACTFLYDGVERRYTAAEATGDERTRAWARAVDWYQGYAQYQTRIRRQIPVFVLEPSVVTGSSG